MPLFSVIIPTYNHCDTIVWALKSAQRQSVQDFEIIVSGDGVPDRTREIMAEFCEQDSRIRFLDNPKGEHKGELNRHKAVLAADGKYIAYLSDDDLWHESHLAVLTEGLEQSDFCHTLHGCVYPTGKLEIFPGDISSTFCREVLLDKHYNFFGPTCVGHTKEAYKRLPLGWSVAPPPESWADLHMWRQWFKAPGLRFLSIPKLTTVHLDSPGRGHMSIEKRAAESKVWLEKISAAGGMKEIEDDALRQVVLKQGCYEFMAHELSREKRKLLEKMATLEEKLQHSWDIIS
ncbi:glycosyltransferase family 2 protein [Kordiimonas sp.]|uniref:glycosyltransferase family 2 protein n=1 Tax=Kordiimonas sp. TaxID=1970157 RepID=UPI003A8F5B63